MSRRSAIMINNKIESVIPLSLGCEICNIYDAFYSCSMCKKNICLRHKFSTKNNYYCIDCLNSNDKSEIIMAEYNNDNKITCIKSIKENLISIISLEWTRPRKIDPLYN